MAYGPGPEWSPSYPTWPQQGWQCPVCHAVMAPWMSQCSGIHTVTTTNTPTVTVSRSSDAR